MTDKVDVRWIQRMDNYKRALAMLQQGVERLTHTADVNENDLRLMQEGLIQRFEYTHELAWNVMKDYEQYQGYIDIHGSRDAIRKGLAIGLIDDPKWMNTIADRNITSQLRRRNGSRGNLSHCSRLSPAVSQVPSGDRRAEGGLIRAAEWPLCWGKRRLLAYVL